MSEPADDSRPIYNFFVTLAWGSALVGLERAAEEHYRQMGVFWIISIALFVAIRLKPKHLTSFAERFLPSIEIVTPRARRLRAKGQNLSTSPSVEFYETRQELSGKRPLVPTIQASKSVWALWNAGSIAWAQDVQKLGRIERLLLPNPYGQVFPFLAAAVDREPEDVANDIRGFTEQARLSEIQVKWFDSLPGNTLTIGEPEGVSGGWAQIELLLNRAGTNERPILRLGQDEFSIAFRNAKNSFDSLWKTAVFPEDAKGAWLLSQQQKPNNQELAVTELKPGGRPQPRQPKQDEPKIAETMPENEVHIREAGKGHDLRFVVENRQSQPKDNYELRIVDVKLWGDSIRDFGPWRPWLNHGKSVTLQESGGQPGFIDFHHPKVFTLLTNPGPGPWHLRVKPNGGIAKSVELQDGDWFFSCEFRWKKYVKPFSAYVRLSSKKGKEKHAEFLDPPSSG